MSTIKVNTIQTAAGTGSLTVPAETGTVVTTASPSLGRRNLIINGAMRIDQRNAGASISGSGYPVDRFQTTNNSDGTFTTEQVEDAPAGFYQSVKFTVTSTDTSLGTTQYARIRQGVEANNVSHLNWGTANAETITVSFWVKSSITGTFNLSILNSAYNYSYPVSYTISSSNTWEQKSITIPGPTSGTWATGTSAGFYVEWALASASNISGTSGSWSANRYEGVTGAVNLMATNGATWYITGVQLEVGTVATPFEHRSYGEELQLCSRYFQRYEGEAQEWIYNEAPNANAKWWQVVFPNGEMRSNPALTFSSGWTGGYVTGLSGTVSSMACSTSPNRASCRVTMSATGGSSYNVHHTDSFTGDYCYMDAEL